MGSVFLEIPEDLWVASNALAFAFRDGFPVADGHTLVVARRVVRDWFEATREKQLAVIDLVDAVKRQLDEEFRPAGYNVGFNVASTRARG
jgi:diadenosine tetraphosphate (Ap4A) HIT family hydrolase